VSLFVPVAPLLWSLPWVITPLAIVVRTRRSRSLGEITDCVMPDAPLVSVVIPARDEAHNIERCLRSVLSPRYARLEVVVVDDHSSDGTGSIARRVARDEPRLTVLDAPDLPAGWFGKQWACDTGARATRGALILFTDADTTHAPDLLPRAVNALYDAQADLLTVVGHQEMLGFWERVIQPQLFALLALRFGGADALNRNRRPRNAIANGQFMLFSRDAYAAIGGHASVRGQVAEDLALAQELVRLRRRMVVLVARAQLSTRMYASLAAVVAGWRKNIYAGGRHAVPGGRAGRALYPLALLAAPLAALAPVVALGLAVATAASGTPATAWLVWSAMSTGASLLFWLSVYRYMRAPMRYALLFPLGAAMLGYIAIGAVARGRCVRWKSRTYTAD
jgi:chlorobactene glucosyltransferase